MPVAGNRLNRIVRYILPRSLSHTYCRLHVPPRLDRRRTNFQARRSLKMFLAEQKGLNNMVPSFRAALAGRLHTHGPQQVHWPSSSLTNAAAQARDRAQALKRLNAQRALEERRSKMGVVRAMLKPGFFGNQEGHSWAPALCRKMPGCPLFVLQARPSGYLPPVATYTSGFNKHVLRGSQQKTAQAGVRSTPGFAGIDQKMRQPSASRRMLGGCWGAIQDQGRSIFRTSLPDHVSAGRAFMHYLSCSRQRDT